MRRLVLFGRMAILAALCLVVAPAFTLPADEWDVNYFVDDGAGGWAWVGENRRLCAGAPYRDGQQSGTYEDVWQRSCSGFGELHTCYWINPWTGNRSTIECPYFTGSGN